MRWTLRYCPKKSSGSARASASVRLRRAVAKTSIQYVRRGVVVKDLASGEVR
jgi:hypothetical protein